MLPINKNNENYFKFVLSHLNILYIEDEKNIRENIEKTLKMLVENVFSCEKIEEAKIILDKKELI